MKPVGKVGDVERWNALLKQVEKDEAARAGRRRAAPPGGQEDPKARDVPSLEGRRAAAKLEEAKRFEASARKAGMPPEAAAHYAGNLRPQSNTKWPFIMLSPSQNSAVLYWIMDHSKRPNAAVKLWGHLFEVLRNDTGEVLATRSELAAHVGIEPHNLSQILTELVSINAVRREPRGRTMRYFLNSNVATHLPGEALKEAARAADGPLLVAIPGGRSDTPAE